MSLVTCQTTGLRPEFAPAPTEGSLTRSAPLSTLATPRFQIGRNVLQTVSTRISPLLALVTLIALLPTLAAAAELRVVEFTSASCTVCRQMQPVMEQFLAKGYPITQIDVDQQADLANRFQITKLPTFVVLRDNQEIGRREGTLSVEEILALFQPPTLQQTPSLNDVTSAVALAAPSISPTADLAPGSAANFSPANLLSPANAVAQENSLSQANAAAPTVPNVAAAPTKTQGPQQLALQASVRIRVEDADGTSYGSGTVIDVHGSEALVVTCGHVFRDSQGKGRILIDTSDGAQVGVAGHLVSYDLTRDVGLISFHTDRPIQPVVVGGAQLRLQPGQPVFSIGCDKGDPPSIRQGQVVALNKYLGPANITVTGQPIDGRSGGGLFDGDGVLVGICNCADPQADEGLYAALPSIHTELDRTKLSFVYRRSSRGATSPQTVPSPQMADAAAEPKGFGSFASAAADSRATAGPNANGNLIPNATPLTTVPALATDSGSAEDVELILIVRSKQNPHTDSKMFVVAQPSNDMLQQVQREVVRQTNARTTSWQQQR